MNTDYGTPDDHQAILDILAGGVTSKSQATANGLRTKPPQRTSTSVTSNVADQSPSTPPAAGPTPPAAGPTPPATGLRQSSVERAQQMLPEQYAALEKAMGPQDYTKMQEYAKTRAQGGEKSLLLALASQVAGKQFQPMGAAFLKRAMEARDPLKTSTGFITETGEHVEDAQLVAEQKIKQINAQIQRNEEIIKSAAVAEEKERARQENNALKEMQIQATNALHRMTAGLAQGNQQNMQDQRTFQRENNLRDDYRKAVEKPQAAIFEAEKVLGSVPNLKNMNAQQQMAMVYNFMRALDPGSVVRESEYLMAAQARGLLDAVWNYRAQLEQGNRLTPDQVKNMQAVAQGVIEAQQKNIARHQQNYADIAIRSRADPRNVIPGYAPPQQEQQAPAVGTSANPIKFDRRGAPPAAPTGTIKVDY